MIIVCHLTPFCHGLSSCNFYYIIDGKYKMYMYMYINT